MTRVLHSPRTKRGGIPGSPFLGHSSCLRSGSIRSRAGGGEVSAGVQLRGGPRRNQWEREMGSEGNPWGVWCLLMGRVPLWAPKHRPQWAPLGTCVHLGVLPPERREFITNSSYGDCRVRGALLPARCKGRAGSSRESPRLWGIPGALQKGWRGVSAGSPGMALPRKGGWEGE